MPVSEQLSDIFDFKVEMIALDINGFTKALNMGKLTRLFIDLEKRIHDLDISQNNLTNNKQFAFCYSCFL